MAEPVYLVTSKDGVLMKAYRPYRRLADGTKRELTGTEIDELLATLGQLDFSDAIQKAKELAQDVVFKIETATIRHVCSQLDAHITAEIVSHPDTNGASADKIERVDGIWYLIVNSYEYSIAISHCPFCGAELK